MRTNMKRRAGLVLVCSFLLTLGQAPAHAGLANAVCGVVRVKVTFSSPLTTGLALSTTVSIDGSVPETLILGCYSDDTENPPATTAKAFGFNSTSGSGSIATTCESFTGGGFFGADLGGGYATGSGTWSIQGFIGGAYLQLSGGNFNAAGVLALDPLTSTNVSGVSACTGSGAKTFWFEGPMVVEDPN